MIFSVFDYLSDGEAYTHQENFLDNDHNRRSNFRLNYNPYNLKKSEDFTSDRKQLKLLRKIALEDNNPKLTDKSTNNENPKYMSNNYYLINLIMIWKIKNSIQVFYLF